MGRRGGEHGQREMVAYLFQSELGARAFAQVQQRMYYRRLQA